MIAGFTSTPMPGETFEHGENGIGAGAPLLIVQYLQRGQQEI